MTSYGYSAELHVDLKGRVDGMASDAAAEDLARRLVEKFARWLHTENEAVFAVDVVDVRVRKVK